MTQRLAVPDMSWHWRAACNADNRPRDVRIEWFSQLEYRPRGRPEAEPTVRRALAVCAHCPVMMQCRQQPGAGVYGGQYRG